jgi:hypothetical protein
MAARSDAAEGGSEAIVFLYYFKDLNDPRQQGKVQYPLNEVLLLCLLAILPGAETIADPRYRLAAGTPRLARTEKRRHGREHA